MSLKLQKIDIPEKLLKIKNPPKELYALGDLSLIKRKKIAIVGSRNALFYSKETTKTLSHKLSSAGVVVVSGGAIGIDAAAHIGAFPNTIAILASSLDTLYPKINHKLLSDISKKGLLLSEYPENTKATKYSFVLRNRLVVGLCDAVVIAQADIGSGSMRSAQYAHEFGVPLYVLSHRLNESSGTQLLVQQSRAKTIEDLDQFVKLFADIIIPSHEEDKIIEFCKKNSDLNSCIKEFGDKIYEYELDGKIKISQMKVVVL